MTSVGVFPDTIVHVHVRVPWCFGSQISEAAEGQPCLATARFANLEHADADAQVGPVGGSWFGFGFVWLVVTCCVCVFYLY